VNELLEILSSPAHWVFEGISDLVFAVPAYLLGRWRLRVHDRRKHNVI